MADGNGADNDGCDDANDDDIVYVDDENSNDVSDIYAFDVAVDIDERMMLLMKMMMMTMRTL